MSSEQEQAASIAAAMTEAFRFLKAGEILVSAIASLKLPIEILGRLTKIEEDDGESLFAPEGLAALDAIGNVSESLVAAMVVAQTRLSLSLERLGDAWEET